VLIYSSRTANKICLHLRFKTTEEDAAFSKERSLVALHSTISPSIARDGTKSSSCDVTSPPKSPLLILMFLYEVTSRPPIYQLIDAAGLDESVLHVNVILFMPFANTSTLPLMFV